MNIVFLLVVLILLCIGGVALFGFLRTSTIEQDERQEMFQRGIAEINTLDGVYHGKVGGYSFSWQGKTFDQITRSGINRFQENETIVTRYPFATSVGKGLRDTDRDVIRISYDLPENPWWLRFIVDEIVLIAPDIYLGKIHVRLTPYTIFTLGYFILEK